ncbi:PD-(D/E)XK nuclease-like domain-containing protein [Streptomyces europaeiscabiei]|uniref:PD-(D/E)XK nuclease-like domain-containing protein n=1 Tax=Streptomyces europaeiscabiei TaxID=146819 RepID=UPI0029BE1D3B|nr:PD-(D/E)XK nuclease-like domain-containing protein [Streptomyces europaeiscabiei]MDX3637764.1 PD-(D/E)XK nuclease-like domain-containing protein [Streptomyces europaeiscabiei]MDX3655576.1 PD-(D/E)XK nuclease-like domain-containing protein [Streptomyces europaeiscabiei]
MTTVAQAGAQAPAAGPVIRDDLTAEQYHADLTSISSTGLRELLDPGCPAQFHYDRHHPKPPKREFDLGNAVHAAVLGKGSDIVEIHYPDYKKADARAQRDIAYDDGKIPLLPKEKEQVDAMAAAIRRHSLAGPLFAPGNGVAERSIYWTDPATGVRCRVRPDWLIVRPEVTVVVDLKTTTDANPKACSKAIAAYSYHQQGALYLDGVTAAGLAPEGARFLFVFQSKKAPYLVTVRELGDQDQDIGRARNERALRLYADCEATGLWPDWTGPVDEIPQISMPSYDTIRQAEEYL